MKILLTGVTGYIGKRLLPELIKNGHQVVCCLRDKNRFYLNGYLNNNISVIEVDFLNKNSTDKIPDDIDIAYYLIHSMSASKKNFESLEELSAKNFLERINKTKVKQVIYLSGIVNEKNLSKHLTSRKNVETILNSGSFALTTLRAGIIVGSGSASFEIIRDLVEKLPLMITPKWLNTKSQPIAIRNVIEYLIGVLNNNITFNKSFDIGGPEILSYKQMLLQFAEVRKLKRLIITLPLMTPRLSSYWLYFVTSTSYSLAIKLVDSMKIEVICKDEEIKNIINIKLLTYKEAINLALNKIKNEDILSSWKDAQSSALLSKGVSTLIEIPQFGCYTDKRTKSVNDEFKTLNKIWSIGGVNGWYYSNWLWNLRGFIDKMFGGVGIRRGRKSPTKIEVGDSLDFWRVLYADKTKKKLVLFAEMKLPGEAWLEFQIIDSKLVQTATFRPLGLLGRLYWYSVYPFHNIIFKGLINKLCE